MSTIAFQPDILVTTPNGVTLVIEAKVTMRHLQRAEQQLKEYMIRTQCPTGVLITPEHMWLYHDSFTGRSPESVRRVGEFDVKSWWNQTPPTQPAPFETFVQNWFEDLARQPSKAIPGELNDSVREYILPALVCGDIRAAHPRSSS